MHPKFEKADRLSKEVIGAMIEVHRALGPGLIESIYEKCLLHELSLRSIKAVNQKEVLIKYKDFEFNEVLRCDLLIEDCLLLELKSVESIHPIHKAQTLSYMKLLDTPIGLLSNFNVPTLKEGLHRLILPGSHSK